MEDKIMQKKTKIAGKMTIALTTPRNTIDVGDTEGHMIGVEEMEGINVSTCKDKFMDGAQVIAMGFFDLVKGNGPEQGYQRFSLNGDAVFWKYEGKIATTLFPNGKSVTTFEGSLATTKGTGKYENIQGSGTYKGKLIPKTIYIVEWDGEYFFEK